MADKKLSELTQHHTTLGVNSRLYTVTDPAGTPVYGYTEYQDIRGQISEYIGDASNPIERAVYVAKNGNDDTANGSIGKPFLTVQAGIEHANDTYPDKTFANPVVVIVYPGIYTEQIHSYTSIWITGVDDAHEPSVGRSGAQIYNGGDSTATYPLRSEPGDIYLMTGITIVTDAGGVIGRLIGGNFTNCYFRNCHWIESEGDEGFLDFQNCVFNDTSYAGWNLTGTNLTGSRNIRLVNCDLQRNKIPIFSSTHLGSTKLLSWYNCDLDGSLALSGDWDFTTIDSRLRSYGTRNTFGTTGKVYIQKVICENGIHFTVEPEVFRMLSSTFKGTGTNYIPDGEADITADVPITNVEFSGNVMRNGLDGEIQVDSTTKKVGGTDSYRTINEAILACSSGDTVRVSVGEYNEEITLPAGVSLNGSERGGSIIYSDTGTVLTKTEGVSNLDKITLKSNPTYDDSTGVNVTNAKLIDISGGELNFNGSILEMTTTNTYVDMIVDSTGLLVFDMCHINYTNKVSGGGTHNLFKMSGVSELSILNSIVELNIADANDDVNIIHDTGTDGITSRVRSTYAHIYMNNVSYDGTVTFWNALCNPKEILFDTTHIHMDCSGNGTGQIFCLDSPAGGLHVHSNANHFEIVGFTNNYVAKIAAGDTLVSHFDDLIADDGVIGAGTYNYVNSPADGDLQISGSYLNMYGQALTVGARGADYTVIQDAIDAITDAAADKRYAILIYPGTYTENIDLSGTPYIDLISVTNRSSTIITSSSGTTLALADEATNINKLTIESTNGKVLEVPAGATGKEFRFNNCELRTIVNNTYADSIEIKSGIVQITDSFLRYIQTGTGGGTHRLVNITGAAVVVIFGSDVYMSVEAVGDDVIGVAESNIVAPTIISNARLAISRNGTVTGDTIGYLANGTSANKLMLQNVVLLENGGSGGYASAIKSLGNGCTILSQGNTIDVLNFDNNYHYDGGATDTFYSFFETLNTADAHTGAATVHEIHGVRSGDLHVTRDIILGRNIEVEGTLELATGTTVNEIATTISESASDDRLITEKSIHDHIHTELLEYIKKDGSVGFTGTVSGITPTVNAHLVTKGYADGLAAGGGTNDLGPFVDMDSTASPDITVIGDKYIIAGTGGDWSGGSINDIAENIDGTSWTFVTPVAGNHGWVTDRGADYTFNGVDWVATGTLIDHTTIQNVGVNTHVQIDTHIADTSNPHAVDKSDVALGNVTNDAQLKRSLNDFNGFGAKALSVDNDRFLMEDSEDSLAKKYILAINMVDKKVKVSSNDTTQDYLANKLIGTANQIVLTEVGDGGNEDLQISVIYGSEFQQTSDDTLSSTAEITFQQKLRMTTSNLPSGTYRIGYYCETYQDNINGLVEIQVELNDTTVIANQNREPADTDDRFSHGGFNYQSLSGVNTIDIDYRSLFAGTAYIRRARIELWRVS